MGLIDFDYYSGFTSQLVGVDVSSASKAIQALVDDPDLRRRMGESGRDRARELYDWNIVFGSYERLWEELSERRRADPQLYPALSTRARPDRQDPFTVFRTYPTYTIEDQLKVRRNSRFVDQNIARYLELRSVSFVKPIMPPTETIVQILNFIREDWGTIEEVCKLSPIPIIRTKAVLVWLCKIGAVDFKAI